MRPKADVPQRRRRRRRLRRRRRRRRTIERRKIERRKNGKEEQEYYNHTHKIKKNKPIQPADNYHKRLIIETRD